MKLLELPIESITLIMKYFNSKDLMLLRCVCRNIKEIIDNNKSIWRQVSYQNMWPLFSYKEFQLFKRGLDVDNKECLIKLALFHLYYYKNIEGIEQTEVQFHAKCAIDYFCRFDKCNFPSKPLTWVFVSESHNDFNLKKPAYLQLLRSEQTNCVMYNLGKMNILATFDVAAKQGYSHASFEQLMRKKTNNLQWFRALYECALSGNTDASFEIGRYFMTDKFKDFIFPSQAGDFCKMLFQNAFPLRRDKIGQVIRAIIVYWFFEILYHTPISISEEIVHHAIYYFDRVLWMRPFEISSLQLLGVTCFVLAVKTYNSPSNQTICESCWLNNDLYSFEDSLKMLAELLSALKSDLWTPTSWEYLKILLSLPNTDSRTKFMVYYIHNMSSYFRDFGSFKPSLLAASTVLLARIILHEDMDLWCNEYTIFSGFQVRDLVNCTALLYYKIYISPTMKDYEGNLLENVKNRYTMQEYLSVANMEIPSNDEIRCRLLNADPMLVCIQTNPILQFTTT